MSSLIVKEGVHFLDKSPDIHPLQTSDKEK